MNEERILFSVSMQGEGTAISCSCMSAEEQFQVALAIHQLISSDNHILLFLKLISELSHDPDFQKALDEATIELPDFNQLLKH